MALTTLAAVKAQGGITDSSRDAQLSAFINGVTAMVKQRLGRNIEQAEHIEYHTGDNTPYLFLRQYPIISVERVCVDLGAYSGQAATAFPAANDLVQGVDYCILPGQKGVGSNGCLRRIGQTWYTPASRTIGRVAWQPPVQSGNILVQYTAGYAVIPAAISMAVNAAILQMSSQAESGGAVQSESYEDASASYFSPEIAAKVFGSITNTIGSFRAMPI